MLLQIKFFISQIKACQGRFTNHEDPEDIKHVIKQWGFRAWSYVAKLEISGSKSLKSC